MSVFRTIGQLFSLEGPGRLRAYAALSAMTVLSSLLDAIGVALIFPLIALIAEPQLIAQRPALTWLYEVTGSTTPRQFVIVLLIGFAGALVLKNVYLVFFYRAQFRFVARSAETLCTRLLDWYLRSPYIVHLERSSAEFHNRIARLARGNFSMAVTALLNLIADSAVVVAVLLTLLLLQPVVTLVAIVLLAAMMAAQYWAFSGRTSRLGQELTIIGDRQLGFLQECYWLFNEIKLRAARPFFLGRFAALQGQLSRAWSQMQFIGRLPLVITEISLLACIVGPLTVLLSSASGAGEILGSLGMLAAAAFRLMPMFHRITTSLNALNENSDAIDVLDREFRGLAGRLEDTTPGGETFQSWSCIRGEGLTFRFPVGAAPALRDVDIEIRRGEFIGLTGHSGSGKTTLGYLLLGLLTADRGTFTVDGRPVSPASTAWRRHVGYVPQAIYLLNDTVRRNVAFGLTDDEIDDARVMRALKMAHLDAAVAALPGGINAELGENGLRLSGGQRQRLGIARALYADADILVLDEATSALDLKTEQELGETLAALKGSKTMVVIAHRLSTLRNCDRIVLLHQGAVKDTGRFSELYEREPEFAHLVDLSNMQTDQPNPQ